MTRRSWTPPELAMLRDLYPDAPTADLARLLGRTVGQVYQAAARHGLVKSAEYLASPAACRLRRGDKIGASHRFAPGGAPWNKGLPGSTGTHPNTRATQFRPGCRSQTEQPVGSLRVDVDGYLWRKVHDQVGQRNKARRWQLVHRMVWEVDHGPVPDGHVVVFRPGRRTADPDLITPDALELITRAELMARNTVHRLPPEVAQAVQLVGALRRQINRRKDAA